jgi:hypothetical protein
VINIVFFKNLIFLFKNNFKELPRELSTTICKYVI